MKKRIGVTGTRFGMTSEQKIRLHAVLAKVGCSEWHHGNCIGVDVESHEVVRKEKPDARIIIHPPIKTEHEGTTETPGDETRDRKSHFARNRDIVDETDWLIVVPFNMEHQSLGGTWYTHDYGIKKNKPVLIIWPDGSFSTRN